MREISSRCQVSNGVRNTPCVCGKTSAPEYENYSKNKKLIISIAPVLWIWVENENQNGGPKPKKKLSKICVFLKGLLKSPKTEVILYLQFS